MYDHTEISLPKVINGNKAADSSFFWNCLKGKSIVVVSIFGTKCVHEVFIKTIQRIIIRSYFHWTVSREYIARVATPVRHKSLLHPIAV